MNGNTLQKKFIRYSTANILGMLGLSCYILADTFFVSRGLGTDGLAALNLAIPVYSLAHGCGLMCGTGGAAIFSAGEGEGNRIKEEKAFASALYAWAGLSIGFVLMGLLASGGIASWLGAQGSIFAMSEIYIRVILLFAPAFMLNEILLCFVRNDGSPSLAMSGMLAGSFSNILLDYLFIFPLNMGMFGAVLATGLAPVISLCLLSIHWKKKTCTLQFYPSRFAWPVLGRILSLGIPSLITEMASGIVIVVFNKLILDLKGNTGVAAYGIIANLSLVISAVYTGLAQGIQPLVSLEYGKGAMADARRLLKWAMFVMLVLSAGMYLVLIFNASWIISVFNHARDGGLQQIAGQGFPLYFAGIPLAGFNILLSAYFASVQKALPAQIISLLRGLILIVPAAWILAGLYQMAGIWLSYPCAELLCALAAGGLYAWYFHGKRNKPSLASKVD